MGKISMKSRKEIIESKKTAYRQSQKAGKISILNELESITGLSRDHLAKQLRKQKRSKQKHAVKSKRGRKPRYTMTHKRLLHIIWELLDYPCSKRLKEAIQDVLLSVVSREHMQISPAIQTDLLEMSHGTMDRLLRADRKRLNGVGRSITKPGSLLKSQIPIRRGTDWNENQIGFVEMDLVAHCGDSTAGEFICSLNVTDIKSGWTECRAIQNKARVHTFEAFVDIRYALPFPLLGIDSDNGSEFINHHMKTYCDLENLVFTRSRPNTSNDGCHVEQKNWSVIRQTIGYARFEDPKALPVFNRIYTTLSLINNFFLPSAKLLSKTRHASSISRVHDKPKTPFRRLLDDPDLDAASKRSLSQIFISLDLILLRASIQKDIRLLSDFVVPYD